MNTHPDNQGPQPLPPTPEPPSASPPPLEPPLPQKLEMKDLFEALLRRPQVLVLRLAEPDHRATGRFGLIALVSFLLFGVVLGCFAKGEQLWAAPLKISAGVLIAGVICFPSLFIFSTLAGARTSVSQLAACLMGALALAGLLLLGFSPAIWIFAESTNSYGFMGVLALAAWGISIMFAFKFLHSAVLTAGGGQKVPMVIWSGIFLLVTLQMTTSLRPIIGRSDDFLTSEKKFFLQHWSDMMSESLAPDATTSAGRN